MVIRNIQLLKYVDCFFKSSLGSLIDFVGGLLVASPQNSIANKKKQPSLDGN